MAKLTRQQRIDRWKRLMDEHQRKAKEVVLTSGNMDEAWKHINLQNMYARKIQALSKKGRN